MPETVTAEVPVQVPVPPSKVVFGWNGFKLPTPELASKLFNVVLGAAFVATVIVHAYPSISHEWADKINEIALGTITAARIICKAFGIKIKDVDTTTVK